jgi:ssDNA-binding Zn-finger/Zn-ribbon topoisomerase 1
MVLDYTFLKYKKLFIGTPMYGGVCNGSYALNLGMLLSNCAKQNIPIVVNTIFNESLITRARNNICDDFLASDSDYLIFIDSDIDFEANDVLEMALWAFKNKDMDIICGAYPKKKICWDKVKKATFAGFANSDSNILSYFTGDFAFNVLNEMTLDDLKSCIREKKPIEISECGTGFMLIKRSVFEKFSEAYPEKKYIADSKGKDGYYDAKEIMAYFDCIIDPVSKRYLSEDFMFCNFVRKLGVKVWLLPWIHLNHIGHYIYQGSLNAVTSINCHPTGIPKLISQEVSS